MTCCFGIPLVLLGIRRFRTVAGTAIASFTVVIGMWVERFLIIVPTLAYPRLHYIQGSYTPRWVEITITAGSFAAFILLYLLFTKLFPIISIWELKEGYHERRERARGELTVIASHEAGGLRA